MVFITKDINARIKGDALGILTEDFEAQKVDFERLYTGWRELAVPASIIDQMFSEKQVKLDAADLYVNEFVLLKDETDTNHTAIGRIRPDRSAGCRCVTARAGVWHHAAKSSANHGPRFAAG